eukprot:5100406-Amphidinium_carterae.1
MSIERPQASFTNTGSTYVRVCVRACVRACLLLVSAWAGLARAGESTLYVMIGISAASSQLNVSCLRRVSLTHANMLAKPVRASVANR